MYSVGGTIYYLFIVTIYIRDRLKVIMWAKSDDLAINTGQDLHLV